MKKLMKVVCIVLSVVIMTSVTGVLGACSGGKGGKDIDETKTQLNINHYNGGFGDQWLEKAIQDFQEEYEDFSFEEGKTGIQIWPSSGKLSGSSLMDQAKYLQDHIFISQAITYRDFVSTGVCLDITDVMTDELTSWGDEKKIVDGQTVDSTIELKLQPEQKEFMNLGTEANPQYYAIPHYFGTNGITYDVEIFNQYKLFFDQNGNMTKKNTDTGLSLGGDGIANTPDDGLPATYEQFFKLCNRLKNQLGITPIIWSGQYQFYSNYLLSALAAEANGYDGHMLTQTLSGVSKNNIVSYSDDGVVTESKTISSKDEQYLVYNQAGYYYALQFMKEIIDKEYYHENSFIGGFTHTDTQDEFIMSNREPSMDPIAMIVEGNWWENEADTTFNTMDGTYPNSSRTERQFGYMPLPKPNEEYIGNHTMLECNTSYMFINANISDNMKLAAKMFLKYINTDVKLREFSVISNTPKALKYELKSEDLAKMSPFGRSVNELKSHENTDVIYQCSTNPTYLANMGGTFDLQDVFSYGEYSFPSTAFYNDSILTVNKFYAGYISAWQSKFAKL